MSFWHLSIANNLISTACVFISTTSHPGCTRPARAHRCESDFMFSTSSARLGLYPSSGRCPTETKLALRPNRSLTNLYRWTHGANGHSARSCPPCYGPLAGAQRAQTPLTFSTAVLSVGVSLMSRLESPSLIA